MKTDPREIYTLRDKTSHLPERSAALLDVQKSRHLAPSPDVFTETRNLLGTVAPMSCGGGGGNPRAEKMLFRRQEGPCRPSLGGRLGVLAPQGTLAPA